MTEHHRHIVIAGGSGLIGSALTASLLADGHRVTQLVRATSTSPRPDGRPRPERRTWDTTVAPPPSLLAQADAVICLNGASIGRLPWTRERRRALYDSRITPAGTLARALSRFGATGPLFICASATGYYGSAPGVIIDESAPAGDTFLAGLCVAWEQAARSGGEQAPVASIRTAPIMHPRALLRPLMPIMRMGLAGPMGRGTQMWPWIGLDDEVRAIRHIIEHRMTGAINLVSPQPASADDIIRSAAHTLRRPFWLPAPEPVLATILGRDAAASLITADAHVVPRRLMASRFSFRSPDLDDALATLHR
jgi:uncharacterized protein (TIGR01777 family)